MSFDYDPPINPASIDDPDVRHLTCSAQGANRQGQGGLAARQLRAADRIRMLVEENKMLRERP